MDIFNAMKSDFIPTPQEYKLLAKLRQQQMPILIGMRSETDRNYLYFRATDGQKLSIVVMDGTHHSLGIPELYISSGVPHMEHVEYLALPEIDTDFIQAPIKPNITSLN